jgi:chemotaxis protein MotB
MASDGERSSSRSSSRSVKKGGHAVHGGAWKIAYADFVTAMMAFFLLMWLLGSTTEGDKKGIADYFSSPLKLSLMASGSGAGDCVAPAQGRRQDLTRHHRPGQEGRGRGRARTINLRALKAEQQRAEAAKLEELKDKVEEKIAANPALAAMKSQIKLDMTRDGLRIQIVDEGNRPMFDSGSAVVKPYMRDLLREIGSVLGEVPNRMTLEGHTDAAAFAGGDRGYSNWELSADRANASRRELMAGGLPADRMLRIQGLARARPSNAGPAGADQPAHQHHRDEPRGRGPRLPHRAGGIESRRGEPQPASIAGGAEAGPSVRHRRRTQVRPRSTDKTRIPPAEAPP